MRKHEGRCWLILICNAVRRDSVKLLEIGEIFLRKLLRAVKRNLEHKSVSNLDKEDGEKSHPAIPTVLVPPVQSSPALGFGPTYCRKGTCAFRPRGLLFKLQSR